MVMVGLNKVKDFLVDDDFINYILAPDAALTVKWDAYFGKYPGDREAAEEARQVLLGEGELQCLPNDENDELKERILHTIASF